MADIILIRGPLGIGKSTISQGLTKKLKAKYYSMDKILEKNGLDKQDDSFTPQDFIKANNIILAEVKDNLKKGKSVILDGCFYFKEQIDHLEKNLSKIYAFNLKAPLEICIKRDSGRKRVYGEQAAREVYELVSKFDYGQDIDTNNKTSDQVIKEILKCIH
jgi:shikimate kinase